ncbi:hypothetical protein CI109_100670 [Kwoniella shandongensis]|uniref:Uncharacterized protein n=1 Tax=Kwoniella shandongensis TaxID=1734106 RepID=A0A5M6C0C4_9TREE|nr:uncharacterized protein CI109_003409 [Kwoniella shandongensis]KAA5528121.1 hypothetical protein CI109_003409 [Kwoniella shandongensis]
MADDLEVEEEFDPSILGLSFDDEPKKDVVSIADSGLDNSSVSLNATDEPNSPVTPISNNRFTALDLLRSISASYASADWTPEGSPFSRSSISSVNGNKRKDDIHHNDNEAQSCSSPYGSAPVARDFAEQPMPRIKIDNIVDGVDGDHTATATDMEVTDSYISTAPSDQDSLHATTRIGPRSHITLVRTRLPGRRHYRTKVKVRRAPVQPLTDNEMTTTDDDIGNMTDNAPSYPEPPTQFQRDLVSAFGHTALEKLEHQAKLDSTSGNQVPPVIRDLFPALADPLSAIRIANVFRRRLELPLLTNSHTKSDKIALRRAIARMRDTLYVEMAAAMSLPLAPIPSADADHTGDEEYVKRVVTMTPSSLQIMATRIPIVFPAEKGLVKAFLADDYQQAYGERQGKVVWQGGVGRMRGQGEGGFRGSVDSSGPCHIYVDHSNIRYGLLHHLATKPNDGLPPRHLRTLSLPCLSLLLRRGRPTPPGSLHLVASSPLHQNLDPLVRLGWEISVLKRVEMYEDEVEDPTSMHVTAKPQARISGSSDMGLRRYREQGVDEILHLKILQVINSKGSKPEKGNTLVLATGDARGGQFNRDGFPGAVREALKRGWNVELWSFSAGLSRAWKEAARKERWNETGKFTILNMDDWAEQLVEVATDVED